MFRTIAAVATAAALVSGSAAIPAVAGGMPPTQGYASCKAMNAGKYPHGVGKKGAKDRTSGKRVTNFKVDNKVYWRYSAGKSKTGYNDLDRDNDGIACEKR